LQSSAAKLNAFLHTHACIMLLHFISPYSMHTLRTFHPMFHCICMYMYVDMVCVCQTWIKKNYLLTYILTYGRHY